MNRLLLFIMIQIFSFQFLITSFGTTLNDFNNVVYTENINENYVNCSVVSDPALQNNLLYDNINIINLNVKQACDYNIQMLPKCYIDLYNFYGGELTFKYPAYVVDSGYIALGAYWPKLYNIAINSRSDGASINHEIGHFLWDTTNSRWSPQMSYMYQDIINTWDTYNLWETTQYIYKQEDKQTEIFARMVKQYYCDMLRVKYKFENSNYYLYSSYNSTSEYILYFKYKLFFNELEDLVKQILFDLNHTANAHMNK